jgi:hypothetical protein
MKTRNKNRFQVLTQRSLSSICFRTVLLCIFFCLSAQSWAQKENVDPPAVDSIVTTVDTLENLDEEGYAEEGVEEPVNEEANTLEADFQKHWDKNIIDQSIYQHRQAFDSTRYKKDEAYWYMNYVPEKKKEVKEQVQNNARGPSFFDSKGFSIFLWVIVIGAFLGILVWFLQTNNLIQSRQNRKVNQQSSAAEEEMGDNIFEMKFPTMIERAKQSGNYALAIRLHYLQTIRSMNDKGLIQYKLDKTNMDYIFGLYNTAHYDSFFAITRMYEFAWYGEYPVDINQYEKIESKFNQFNQQIA